MKQNFLIPLACGVLLATSAAAQTHTVSGRVTDATGSGLPGVTVLERGTTNGTSTGADGSFSLAVQPGAILVLSSIGFESQNVVVGDRTTVAISLKSSATELGEAVVVGYGTQSKADLTGSVTQLSSKDVGNQPVQSFEQSIQGRAAGVFIENSSGKLGQGIRVRVRGVSSISGDTQPLYVVDGIPILADNLSSTSGATNPIADINPNDIESITILKDASASAIYGSRASNGVVLITTKRGKSGATRFTLGFQTGSSSPTNKREFLNNQEYVTLLTEALVNSGRSATANATRLRTYAAGAADPLTYNTDWQDQVFQDAPFSQYDLSASGGNEKTRFFVSGQYSNQNGIIVGNKYERISTRFNVDHKANDRLAIGINAALSRSRNQRLPNDNAFSNPMQIVALAPITPLIDPRTELLSGSLDPATGQPNTTFPFYYNPLLSIENGSYNTIVYRTLSNVYAQLDIVKGLSYRSELGVDVLNQSEDQFLGRITSRNTGPTNGFGFSARSTNARVVVNNFATYRNTFNEQHSLDLTLGTSFESAQLTSNNVTGTQFASDAYKTLANASLITAGGSNRTNNTLVSYFGRANYAFAGKYLLGVSARYDGSSRFGSNNRYGFFPAASLGWLATEEAFLKDNAVLSMLKPRISIGRTGNQGFTNFASRALFSGTSGYVGIPGQRPISLASPDLTWESTTQADAGIEFGLFKDRISGEVDVYEKRTTDLALFGPVPGTTGFTSLFRNIGSLRNRGAEFSLTTRNFVGDFTWTTSFNASRNINRITDLDGPPILGSFLNRAQEGEPLGVFVGPEYAGVNPDNGDALYYLNSTNADGTVNRGTTNNINEATSVVVGDPNPKWTGGITNTFSFKGFDLTATLVGVFGNSIFDGAGQYYSVGFNNGPDNQTRDQLQRWQKPGDITNVPRAEYLGGNGIGLSSRFVRDGSYGRLRTIALGYNLPAAWAQKVFLQSARVFVQGLNLVTFTKYKGWDPEVSTDYLTGSASQSQNNINQGIDFYTAPQPKTYTIGVNIGF
ncbi:SusC/RagA family TonB-linked outer membrane protein [Hymenobacter glacieicola]|uniref:SusC/RagA family TonB-linked outer membrane protein n=1 Tax=Hymenobacter glacieicola TaxID=1562124 RepID=UPI001668B556|nr:TonB-dependent receptor [Hymenobacter glacieicola]